MAGTVLGNNNFNTRPLTGLAGNYLGQSLGGGFPANTLGTIGGNVLNNYLQTGGLTSQGLFSGIVPGGSMTNLGLSKVPGIGSYFSSPSGSVGSSLFGTIAGKALPAVGAGLSAYNGINKMRNGQGYGTMNGLGTGASVGTMIMPGIGTGIGAGVGALAGWLSGIGKPNDDEMNARSEQNSDFSKFGLNLDQINSNGGLFDPRNKSSLDTYDNFFNTLMANTGGNGNDAAKLSGELLDTRNTGNYNQGRSDLAARLQRLSPQQLSSLFPQFS